MSEDARQDAASERRAAFAADVTARTRIDEAMIYRLVHSFYDRVRADYSATIRVRCARRSWRVPAGESPARVRGSARPAVSVAAWKATTTAKRTQQSCGVWE